MNYIDYLNLFGKYIFINLITFYTNFKISSFKTLKCTDSLFVILVSLFISGIFTFFSKFFNPSFIIIIPYIVFSFSFSYITKYKLTYSFVVTLISMAITLSLYVLSTFTILSVLVYLLHLPKENPIILILAILLESSFINLLFKIKRFKNGFSFLHNQNQYYGFILSISLIVVLIFIVCSTYINKSISKYSLSCLALIFICIFLWIKEKITLHYKGLLAKDTIDNLQNKLDEQININKNLHDELDKISSVNHKFSSRISALELYVSKLSTPNSSKITHDHILEAQNLIRKLSCEFSDDMQVDLNNNFEITKTGIINIDTILEYFKVKCTDKNIKFDIIVKSNIEYTITKSIPLNLLETLISDMLNNSMIAIRYSSRNLHKILVQFDIVDNFFEFRIYDTGIEFEIETFLKMGKERITT